MYTSVKIIKLTNQWYPNLAIHIWLEILQSEDSKKTEIVEFHLYFKSNCPRNSTPKFRFKMNSRWSNVKLKGQMVMKFYELHIHGKLMKQKIQWDQNKIIWT